MSQTTSSFGLPSASRYSWTRAHQSNAELRIVAWPLPSCTSQHRHSLALQHLPHCSRRLCNSKSHGISRMQSSPSAPVSTKKFTGAALDNRNPTMAWKGRYPGRMLLEPAPCSLSCESSPHFLANCSGVISPIPHGFRAATGEARQPPAQVVLRPRPLPLKDANAPLIWPSRQRVADSKYLYFNYLRGHGSASQFFPSYH